MAATAKGSLGERGRTDGVSTRLPAPRSAPSRPASEQEALGSDRKHVVRSGRVVNGHVAPAPTHTTSGLGRRSERQAAHTDGPCKSAGPEAPLMESQPPRSKHAISAPTPPSQSHLDDLHENICTQACNELTCHLLSTTSFLPTSDARPKSVLKCFPLNIRARL
jgi:hypothetical protein